jgi:oligopeptide transport system permease protein
LRKKWMYIISALGSILIIFLLSNIHKGIIIEPIERLQLEFSAITPVTLEEIKARLPHITIEDPENNQIRVDPEKIFETDRQLKTIPGVLGVNPLPGMPSFSWSNYGKGLVDQFQKLLSGDWGTIVSIPSGKHTPLVQVLPQLIFTTFTYLIPGLLLGILLGLLFAILASLRKSLGYVLDQMHKLLMLLPDFVIIVILQLIVIYIVKLTDEPFILIAQIGPRIPFLIPLLTIIAMPAFLVYGAVRAGIIREQEESYVKTAYSKGLSSKHVLFKHILRNVMEDLFTILPRATTAAVASMIIVEVICLIMGLGGIVLSKYFYTIGVVSTICMILALFTILVHLFFAWLRKKLVIHTGEAMMHE